MTPQDTVNKVVGIIVMLGTIGVALFTGWAIFIHQPEPKRPQIPTYVYEELSKKMGYSVELAYVAKDRKGKIYIVQRRSHD